ncbi:hypothetical protein [Paenibacillus sp. OV219]|uniref:hypothetical protein n=1 Tax=Paenibacillus sp. OV219 TaxID=1884377 RepID=UPI0008CCDF24|nr:hypothetical protein [Paenibacillus sp. OV219]SEN55869.1 hypothetical protein SAMN05518847_103200 [Paenibacillus sp. OV219]
MTLSQVNRYFAMCGIASLLVTIACFFGNAAGNDGTDAFDYLTILAWILVLFGLFGSYFSQIERLGALGFVGFLGLTASTIGVIGTVMLHNFAFPVIDSLHSGLVADDLLASDLPSPISDALLASSYTFTAGPVLYGLAILLRSTTARWPGALLIIVGLSSGIANWVGILGLISYIGFPIAAFWMGVQMLRKSSSLE